MILKESAATAWVDGQNGIGPVVGNFCMDLAIKKAKECGVGWVVAKGSNHYGIAGWYSMKAVEQHLIVSITVLIREVNSSNTYWCIKFLNRVRHPKHKTRQWLKF